MLESFQETETSSATHMHGDDTITFYVTDFTERVYQAMLPLYGNEKDAREHIDYRLDRSDSYRKMQYISINELVMLLKQFRESGNKLCGVLHEREPDINKHRIEAQYCRNKFYNPCCAHPEENGLTFALLLAEGLLEKSGQSPQSSMRAQTHLLNSRALDREVYRTGRGSDSVFLLRRDQKDIDSARKISQNAIASQKVLGDEITAYISLLITGLEEIIASGLENRA